MEENDTHEENAKPPDRLIAADEVAAILGLTEEEVCRKVGLASELTPLNTRLQYTQWSYNEVQELIASKLKQARQIDPLTKQRNRGSPRKKKTSNAIEQKAASPMQTNAMSVPDELLTAEQVAEILSCSASAVYQGRAAAKGLTPLRFGKRRFTRWSYNEVQQLIATKLREAQESLIPASQEKIVPISREKRGGFGIGSRSRRLSREECNALIKQVRDKLEGR